MSTGSANLEQRVTKLERTNAVEVGAPVSNSYFPVRKLKLSEHTSYSTNGVPAPVLVAQWTAPAGVLTPTNIKLTHNGTVVMLSGTATDCRITGYSVGTTIQVSVLAMYSGGNSSAVVASRKLTGDTIAPSMPTNLHITAGFRTLTVSWVNPTDDDFSHVEIWESLSSSDLATAERIATATGTEFIRANCGVLETRWYWVRAFDENGNNSEFTAPASGTTTAIQAEDIPADLITESMLASTLAEKIDDSDAAIKIIESVRSGEVEVFRQPSAPTSGMTTGDLWINNLDVVYRYEGGAWVAKLGSVVYDLLKTAISQYMVKTQTSLGDGKIKVAGFGLYNDASTGSEFAVLADKFYVYSEKANGSSYSNVRLFSVDSTQTPPKIGINGDLIVDGSISGEKIFAGSKIQLGDGGELIMGEGSLLQMSSGVFMLDSEAGVLQVRDPSDVTHGNFIKIESGDITTYKELGGVYYPMKSLRKMVTGGNVPNGTQVTLTGVFPSEPNIFVSQCNLQCYNPSYSLQKQSLLLQATNVDYNSLTGKCSFIPKAELVVSGGAGTVSAISSASKSTGTATVISYPYVFTFAPISITLGSKTIPANVSTVTINAKIYAQAMHNASFGTTFGYCLVPHIIDYVIYAKIDGTDYIVGSGSITRPVSLIVISSEPTTQYINKQQTITVNTTSSKTIIIWASISPRNEVESLNYALGYEDSPISITPYNLAWLACSSVTYILASTSVLASGTLNYIAIAE